MTKNIVVLDPAQIKPGLITPYGRTVKAVNMYVNEASGFLVFDLKLDDGKQDVLMYPLGTNWKIGEKQ